MVFSNRGTVTVFPWDTSTVHILCSRTELIRSRRQNIRNTCIFKVSPEVPSIDIPRTRTVSIWSTGEGSEVDVHTSEDDTLHNYSVSKDRSGTVSTVPVDDPSLSISVSVILINPVSGVT